MFVYLYTVLFRCMVTGWLTDDAMIVKDFGENVIAIFITSSLQNILIC